MTTEFTYSFSVISKNIRSITEKIHPDFFLKRAVVEHGRTPVEEVVGFLESTPIHDDVRRARVSPRQLVHYNGPLLLFGRASQAGA